MPTAARRGRNHPSMIASFIQAAALGHVVQVNVPPTPLSAVVSPAPRPVIGDFPRAHEIVKSPSTLVFPAVTGPSVRAMLPSTMLASRSGGGPIEVDLDSFFEDANAPASSSNDAADKAKALRAANAQEETEKQRRAATAIERMEAENSRAEALAVRMANSGVEPCQESVWGNGQDGLLQAKACYRVRDGVIESRPRTGALLIF